MKLSEMREKTVEELKQLVVDSKKQLLDSRIKLSMHKLDNTANGGFEYGITCLPC